jgi:DNA-binding transcriptional MerR regulator
MRESRSRDQEMTNPTASAVSQEARFYRIGEVSKLTALKPFVLRYWETEFPMLEPVKSPSGHRLYRQQDVDLVLKIKRLLYDEGFTIAGARRFLRESGNGEPPEASASEPVAGTAPTTHLSRKVLLDLRDSLHSFLTLLERK